MKKEQEARRRVCLALDVPSVADALELAEELADFVGLFKVGKQLHTAACNEGVPIVDRVYAANSDGSDNVFLDLKLHDTPNTVLEAARESAVPGVNVFNVHVAGGEVMCKKAVEGAYEGSQQRKIRQPKVIGVTELTSLNDDDLKVQGLGISYDDLVKRRTELAREWGLDGVVCPANKAGELEKRFGPDFIYVTPGIEWGGLSGAGQKQLYTPDRAVRDCSCSVLVIGSAITKAGNVYEQDKKRLARKGTSEDRRKTAYEIIRAMAKELSSQSG